MNDLFDTQQDDSSNRSLASQPAIQPTIRNGIRPVARLSPADYQTSDSHGPGPSNSFRTAFGEQSFAMIAAYSLVILLALGYVPGLGLGLGL